jgi:hypothetical protein
MYTLVLVFTLQLFGEAGEYTLKWYSTRRSEPECRALAAELTGMTPLLMSLLPPKTNLTISGECKILDHRLA